MHWKRISGEAFALIATAMFLAAATNAFLSESRKLAWVKDYQTLKPELRHQGSSGSHPATPESALSYDPSRSADLLAIVPPKDPSLLFLEISAEIARRLYDAGAPFMDARRSNAYQEGHIANAINIPVWEHDAQDRISALHAKGMKPDQVMVVYCSGGSCEDGPRLAEELALAGFFNIFLYKDGFPDWQERKWPLAKGKRP